jgi:hypothetical protein
MRFAAGAGALPEDAHEQRRPAAPQAQAAAPRRAPRCRCASPNVGVAPVRFRRLSAKCTRDPRSPNRMTDAAYVRAAVPHRGRGQDHHLPLRVVRWGWRGSQSGGSAFSPRGALPAVVVGERAQRLHADREPQQHASKAAGTGETVGQEQEQGRQRVGQQPRAPALATMPFAPAPDQQPVRHRGGAQRRHQASARRGGRRSPSPSPRSPLSA